MSLVLFVMLSVLRIKDNLVIELVQGEKNFKTYQNEHKQKIYQAILLQK